MAFFGLAAYGSASESDRLSGSESDESDADSASDAAEPRAPVERAKKPSLTLPSADDAFGAVSGPPQFLAPEATRPIARAASHAPPERSCVEEPEVRRREAPAEEAGV